MEELKACPPFKRFTRTYDGGEAWLPAGGISFMGDGELTGPAIDRLALYESLLQMEPAEAALKLRRAASENDYAALKAKYDEINRYNISCTKKIDELLAEKLDTDAHLKAISDSLSAQLAVAAPEPKGWAADTLERLIPEIEDSMVLVECQREALREGVDALRRAASENSRRESGAETSENASGAGLPRGENEPLTLEELRQMDGEPVWIQRGKMGLYRIVKEISCGPCGGEVRFTDSGPTGLRIKDYGKTWLAYARKPKGSEKNGFRAQSD